MVLLEFAARRGAVLEPTDVQAILGYERGFLDGGTTVEEDNAFWLAYSHLAAQARPVTVASIEACRTKESGASGWFSRREISDADAAVDWYRLLALLAFGVLIVVQAYWFYGSRVYGDLISSIAAEEENDAAIEEQKKAPDGPERAAVLENLKEEQQTLAGRIDAYTDQLGGWAAIAGFTVPTRAEATGRKAAIKRQYDIRAVASFLLETLQRYLLPLLYGLLGSSVYVLRSLAAEIHAVAFESAVSYRLRLPLGALAGAAASLFFGDFFARSDSPFQSISPFTLAFLGGYSVELVFSAMDRLIGAFSPASERG